MRGRKRFFESLLAGAVGAVAGILFMLIGGGLWSYVFSAPPASPFNLGETLVPDCTPGSVNCTVVPPAASGANSDITSLSGLITPLSVGQGGTGVSTTAVTGSLFFAGTGGVLTSDASNLFWNSATKRLGVGTSTPSNSLEVIGTVAGTHLKGTGGAPSVSVGGGAGSGASASVLGTDVAGEITLNTGALPSTGAIVLTVTFDAAYNIAPRVVFVPSNATAALLSGTTMVNVGSNTTNFTFTSGSVGLTPSVQYKWHYIVIE